MGSLVFPMSGHWVCPDEPRTSLTAVSPVAGADPEARLLGGPVCAWLGVRVFGEGRLPPEPGQVSLGPQEGPVALVPRGWLRWEWGLRDARGPPGSSSPELQRVH